MSPFVKSLLNCEDADAQGLLATSASRYSIVITRFPDAAKRWVQEQVCVRSDAAFQIEAHCLGRSQSQWNLKNAFRLRRITLF